MLARPPAGPNPVANWCRPAAKVLESNHFDGQQRKLAAPASSSAHWQRNVIGRRQLKQQHNGQLIDLSTLARRLGQETTVTITMDASANNNITRQDNTTLHFTRTRAWRRAATGEGQRHFATILKSIVLRPSGRVRKWPSRGGGAVAARSSRLFLIGAAGERAGACTLGLHGRARAGRRAAD